MHAEGHGTTGTEQDLSWHDDKKITYGSYDVARTTVPASPTATATSERTGPRSVVLVDSAVAGNYRKYFQ